MEITISYFNRLVFHGLSNCSTLENVKHLQFTVLNFTRDYNLLAYLRCRRGFGKTRGVFTKGFKQRVGLIGKNSTLETLKVCGVSS